MVRLLPNLLPTPKPLYGHEMKKPLQINDLQGFSLFGGVDGTLRQIIKSPLVPQEIGTDREMDATIFATTSSIGDELDVSH